jgi:folate-binding protein YgfZ
MPDNVTNPFPNPLGDLHEAAGAEFQAYDRLEIVSTFGEPQAEYAALRKGAALMDEPQRGVLELTGRDRLPFLNNLLTHQTWDKDRKTGMPPGTGVYALFLNLKGRIVADMNVIERGDRTLVETDVRLVEPLRDVFDRYLFGEQVKMVSRVGALHRLTLHGPRAAEVIRDAAGLDVAPLPLLGSLALRLFDCNTTVFRDDITGVPGFHLLVDSANAADIWFQLLAQFGESPELGKRRLRRVGWAAFNACRIEAGRPLFGIDFEGVPASTAYPSRKQREEESTDAIGPGVLPAETGLLQRAVSFTKGCYLGQEIVARMYARGQVAKQIVGLWLQGDHLPIAGAPVMDDQSNTVGVITSSTISPLLSNQAICLGYARKQFTTPGTTLRVPAEGSLRPATVVELPFVRLGNELRNEPGTEAGHPPASGV